MMFINYLESIPKFRHREFEVNLNGGLCTTTIEEIKKRFLKATMRIQFTISFGYLNVAEPLHLFCIKNLIGEQLELEPKDETKRFYCLVRAKCL
uniref:Uncharacterized protein n=1 Tax=Ditylenchus dipsaci TaxID=166011 RepID=A0A915DGR9_9BILA